MPPEETSTDSASTSAASSGPPLRKRDAAYQLSLWQLEHGVSCKELAAMLGCAPWTVSALRRGYARPDRARAVKPGRVLAVKIERVTGVLVESWDEG